MAHKALAFTVSCVGACMAIMGRQRFGSGQAEPNLMSSRPAAGAHSTVARCRGGKAGQVKTHTGADCRAETERPNRAQSLNGQPIRATHAVRTQGSVSTVMAGGLRIVALWLIGMVVGGGRAANSVGSSCTNFDSNMGSSFDLRELQRTTGQPSYRVEDGDIPCTKYVSQAIS